MSALSQQATYLVKEAFAERLANYKNWGCLMKRYKNLSKFVLLLLFLSIFINGIGVSKAQKKEVVIKGLIKFDFVNAPKAKKELNLGKRLLWLLALINHAKPLKMLNGLYARVYDSSAANIDNLIRYYENKLKKEDWELVKKAKVDSKAIQVYMLFGQREEVYGIFVIVVDPTKTTLINMVGPIALEETGKLSNLFKDIKKTHSVEERE